MSLRVRPRAAVTVLFLVHAAVLGAWTPAIPGITGALHLSTAQLGLALAAEPVGAGLVMVPAGALISRFGSRRVLAWSVVPYALTTAAIGMAPSLAVLAGALFLWGASQGVMNIAINAQGIVVEEHLGRHVLAGLHGWWSLGAFGGALVGSLAVARGVSPAVQLGAAGGLALLAIAAVLPSLLPDTPRADAGEGRRRLVVRPSPRLVALAAIAFCCLLCEGAVLTWSALFLTGAVGAAAGLAGLAYAAYALMMAVARMTGDRVMARWGARTVLCGAAVAGAVAMSVALLVRDVPTALLGFAALGVGLALVMPFVTRSAAQASPQAVAPAIALVSSSGWLGVVAGPPVVGALAVAVTLGNALWLLVALPVVIAVAGLFLFRADASAAPVEDEVLDAVGRS
ncbi:MFS transporter [Cellulomonas sp. P5_C5]